MSYDTTASVLWGMLFLSLVLTPVGLVTRQWWVMSIAAFLSLVFGLAAILSVGIFVIAFVASLQTVAAVALFRDTGKSSMRQSR